jgi:hypothetical protein
MPVSSQFQAIQPKGIKKKKNLYAPMVQEQAAQGIATQAVIARKQQEQQEADTQFRDDQFAFQQQAQEQQNQQWQQEVDMQNQQFQAQMEHNRNLQSQAETAQQQNIILGGISTAANLFDAVGGFDWLSDLWG